MTADKLLNDVLAACARVSAAAMENLEPGQAACLSDRALYVAVRTHPAPRARVLVQVDGATTVIAQVDGAAFPVDLGEAAAAVLEAGLGQLADDTRAGLARQLDAGGSLGLLASCDTGCVHLVVDDGGATPWVLTTLQGVEVVH